VVGFGETLVWGEMMAITLQKIAGAILFALILLVGVNMLVNGVMPQRIDRPTPEIAAAEGGFDASAIQAKNTPAPAAASAEEEKPLAQRLAAADAGKGRGIAKKCLSCHTFDEGAGAKIGPNLYGVVGRVKATFPGFAYSDAFKKLSGPWSVNDLDTFLTKPGAYVPGTKMTFAGLPSGEERADVIAYLRSISPNAPPP
jgi:cytochrome c